MIIGAQAVLIHGRPRFTGDIDITLGIDTDESKKIFTIAKELSLKPMKGMTTNFVRRNALLSVEDKRTKIVVDFIFSFLPYERQAIKRAKRITLGKTKVRFATAEDTIIHKMFAGRALDIEDVKGIITHTKKLNKKYLKQWLKEFSIVAGRDLVQEYSALEKEVKR
jgi:predicted nucleotidyltransferase